MFLVAEHASYVPKRLRAIWKTDPDEFLEKTKRGGNNSGDRPPFDRVSWDFVGWREHVGDAFLFEVKTGRHGIRPDVSVLTAEEEWTALDFNRQIEWDSNCYWSKFS